MAPSLALFALLFVFCSDILFQCASGASTEDVNRLKELLIKRIVPNAPAGYKPAKVSCPSNRPSIRLADGLSLHESSWLKPRRTNTISPMKDLLSRLDIDGFDVDSFFKANANNIKALPNIAIAASGGGYRALTNGAGALAAFDDRTSGSTSSKNQLGGLLQSATYLSGLSGGSWLVSSLYMNNFSSVEDIVHGLKGPGHVWDFANSILEGPSKSGIDIINTGEYYDQLYNQVESKKDAGYQISFTDYWGRALSYQIINAVHGGPGYTWSGLADDPRIKGGDIPLPIVVADGRAPGQKIIPGNATIYEFTPWEMGSWDVSVYGFAPIKYVGSKFNRGKLPESEDCIAGYDSASFIFGTSSTLFNQFLLQLNTVSGIPSFLKDAIRSVLTDIGKANDDIAQWKPSPFHNWDPAGTSIGADTTTDATSLYLVDGGEDLENIPLHPLIQPYREVDVIFAVDSSADTTTYWPNGTSLVASYQRSLNATQQNGTAFPVIPDQNTIINLGLNTRPAFFGCDAANATNAAVASWPAPLIVYLANTPYATLSNKSTFTLSYSNALRNAIITNGYDVVTQGNGTADKGWGACVGCAIMRRAWERAGTSFPSVCDACFKSYCWNGTLDSSLPKLPFDPVPRLKLINVKNAAAGGLRAPTGLAALAVGVAAGVWLLA